MVPSRLTRRMTLFSVSAMNSVPSGAAVTSVGPASFALVAGRPSPHQLREPVPGRHEFGAGATGGGPGWATGGGAGWAGRATGSRGLGTAVTEKNATNNGRTAML